MSGDLLRKTHNTKAWLFASLSFLWSMVINFSPIVIGIYLLFQKQWIAAILIPILLYLVIGFYMAFWPFIALISFFYGWKEYGFVESLIGTALFVVFMYIFLYGSEWLMYKAFKSAEKAEEYESNKQDETSLNTNMPMKEGYLEEQTCKEVGITPLSEGEQRAMMQNNNDYGTEEDTFLEEEKEEEELQNQIIDKIASHLEFLGYQLEKRGEYLFASHAKRVNLWVRSGSGGFFVQGVYKVGKSAKADRNGFLEAMNELNSKSIIVRFWTETKNEEPSLFMDIWIPNSYDKAVFGTIMDSWHYDTGTLLFQVDSIKNFFDYS